MFIREDDLTGKAIARLLQEQIEDMHRMTPPE
ncbi:MAG: GNAT family N-acetyltransferase, partial [Symploca sp. SIO2B6]|nr:GNAT family N-acetyltransferase [Symploca sp. SIO2B6]